MGKITVSLLVIAAIIFTGGLLVASNLSDTPLSLPAFQAAVGDSAVDRASTGATVSVSTSSPCWIQGAPLPDGGFPDKAAVLSSTPTAAYAQHVPVAVRGWQAKGVCSIVFLIGKEWLRGNPWLDFVKAAVLEVPGSYVVHIVEQLPSSAPRQVQLSQLVREYAALLPFPEDMWLMTSDQDILPGHPEPHMWPPSAGGEEENHVVLYDVNPRPRLPGLEWLTEMFTMTLIAARVKTWRKAMDVPLGADIVTHLGGSEGAAQPPVTGASHPAPGSTGIHGECPVDLEAVVAGVMEKFPAIAAPMSGCMLKTAPSWYADQVLVTERLRACEAAGRCHLERRYTTELGTRRIDRSWMDARWKQFAARHSIFPRSKYPEVHVPAYDLETLSAEGHFKPFPYEYLYYNLTFEGRPDILEGVHHYWGNTTQVFGKLDSQQVKAVQRQFTVYAEKCP